MEINFDDLKQEIGKGKAIEVDQDELLYQRQLTYNWLKEEGLLPPNDKIMNMMVDYLAETKLKCRTKGLLIISGTGTGKTIALKTIKKVRDLKFFTADTMTKRRSDDSNYLEYAFQMCEENIIIDDLGAELPINDFGVRAEFMSEVIIYRYREYCKDGRLTLFSTNLTRDEIGERYGERVLSRLIKMCELISCGGQDLRLGGFRQ